ncbi:MAG: DUF4136 domain-containing protein [Bacteroidales bacterium]|nr:DUF4136 domain-containing protein [Bacteroidales bacterium]
MRNMKRSNVIAVMMLIPLMGLLTGCYPDKIDYVDEYDLAGTMFDEDADFSSYLTFHVLDTVMHLTEDKEDDPNLSREHDEFILEEIRQNMRDAGYTEMVSPDSLNMPDLEIFVQVMSSDFYTYYSYWYDYWYWYPGWGYWYPGWGGWYPGYPWYPGYVSSYSTGTLIVEMLDTEATLDATDRPGMVWAGIVDGLLTNNTSNTKARLDKQINQLFEQSPYLQH